MRRTSSVRTASFLGVAGVGLAVVLLIGGCSGGGGKKPRLNGGGSSFVNPMMEKWSGEYVSKGVEVDYTSSGSGDGVTKMIERKNDFGCTDAPMNEEQLKKAGGADAVIHVPLVMGAVVPIYYLPGVDEQLHFTGDVLARIYLGDIDNWSHKDLKALNKSVDLPDLKIHVVHRSDPSGTSHIFTDYLSEVSKEWKQKVGKSTNPTWKVGEGAQKNPGVAKAVQLKKGAIGYVELIYALQNKETLSFGLVQNADGDYPEPTIESVTKAAEAKLKDIPDDLRFSLVNPPKGVKGAYPISGTVWAVCYVKQPKEKVNVLKDFLRWAIHDGQNLAKEKHYARLPSGLADKADKKIELIQAE